MTEALEMAKGLNMDPEIARAALNIIRLYVAKNMGQNDLTEIFDFLPSSN
jgi:hypothetical protein